jgi:hypothetical protein
VTATGAEIAADVGVAVPTAPDETGEMVTLYEVIAAPPVSVAGSIETLAVVIEVVVAATAAGALGTFAAIAIVTVAVPVAVAPPATVVEAVIV